MTVWILSPAKPPKPAEAVTKGEGHLVWRRGRMACLQPWQQFILLTSLFFSLIKKNLGGPQCSPCRGLSSPTTGGTHAPREFCDFLFLVKARSKANWNPGGPQLPNIWGGGGEKGACSITTGCETPGSPWRRSLPCRHGVRGQSRRERSGWGVCNFRVWLSHWELLHRRSCPSQGRHPQPVSVKRLPLGSQRTLQWTFPLWDIPPAGLRLCQAGVSVQVLAPSSPRPRSPVNFSHPRRCLSVGLQGAQAGTPPGWGAGGQVCIWSDLWPCTCPRWDGTGMPCLRTPRQLGITGLDVGRTVVL